MSDQKAVDFPTLSKIRAAADFRRAYSNGQRYHSPYFTAFILLNELNQIRLGITVTRKVGNAVFRNRCKRRIREVFRDCPLPDQAGSGFDLVVNAKSELATVEFKLLKSAFEQTIKRVEAFIQKRRASHLVIEAEKPLL